MDEEERRWVRADPWLVDEVEVIPSSGTRNWSNAFSFASCARQPKPSRQRAVRRRMKARLEPYRHPESGISSGHRVRASRSGPPYGRASATTATRQRLGYLALWFHQLRFADQITRCCDDQLSSGASP